LFDFRIALVDNLIGLGHVDDPVYKLLEQCNAIVLFGFIQL